VIRNAVEYATARTTLEIRAERDGPRVRISFSNETEGLTTGDLERVFDRFWRRDASRTGEHAGLGLALARSFARALGGDVTAALHGTRVTFTPQPRRRPDPRASRDEWTARPARQRAGIDGHAFVGNGLKLTACPP
jgi:K+-sensing histidine kinase KdpD